MICTYLLRSLKVGALPWPTTRSISFWTFRCTSGSKHICWNKKASVVGTADNDGNEKSTHVKTSCSSATHIKIEVKWNIHNFKVQKKNYMRSEFYLPDLNHVLAFYSNTCRWSDVRDLDHMFWFVHRLCSKWKILKNNWYFSAYHMIESTILVLWIYRIERRMILYQPCNQTIRGRISTHLEWCCIIFHSHLLLVEIWMNFQQLC